MNTKKIFITGMAIVAITALFISPVQAHRKYRPHFKGLPRHILVQHSHDSQETAKLSVGTQADLENFDLFNETARLIDGIVKTIGKVPSTVLDGRTKLAD